MCIEYCHWCNYAHHFLSWNVIWKTNIVSYVLLAQAEGWYPRCFMLHPVYSLKARFESLLQSIMQCLLLCNLSLNNRVETINHHSIKLDVLKQTILDMRFESRGYICTGSCCKAECSLIWGQRYMLHFILKSHKHSHAILLEHAVFVGNIVFSCPYVIIWQMHTYFSGSGKPLQ